MSRTATFTVTAEKVRVLTALQAQPALRGHAPASYFLMKQLVQAGLVDYSVGVDAPQGVRGRKLKQYRPSGKGRSLMALVGRNKAKVAQPGTDVAVAA